MITITLNNIYNSKIDAYPCGKYLAISKKLTGCWNVYHIATGNALSNGETFPTKKAAMAFGEHMEKCLDLNFHKGESFKEDRETCFAAFHAALKLSKEV